MTSKHLDYAIVSGCPSSNADGYIEGLFPDELFLSRKLLVSKATVIDALRKFPDDEDLLT